MRLSNIKMAWKMALITFIISLGVIGVALAGWRGLESLRFHLSNIYDFMLIPILTINQADIALSDAEFQIELLKNPSLSLADRTASIERVKAAETEALGTFDRYNAEWATTISPEFTAILRDFGRLDLQEDETTTLVALRRNFDSYIIVREAYLVSVQARNPDSQLANTALNLLAETRSKLRHLIEVNNKFAELSNQAGISAYRQSLINMSLAFGLMLLFGLSLSFVIARSITQPLGKLARVASSLQQGHLEQPVQISGRDEIGVLAQAFNAMTGQLQELIKSLETRVAARTRRLEIAATLSERLTAILNLEELLAEVVNQIIENFDYYHAHVYLLDEKGGILVMAEGSGAAGAEMKAKGHNIRLDAPTSLVARAARTGQIVWVDNVREARDWLPNPLLPDTYSEMAVPIILEEKVVGVLDVQQDKIAGLDEGDANLLRSLANQVAVTIRNARQFAQVEAALTEAHELQRKYISDSWELSQAAKLGVGQVKFSLGELTTLSDEAIAKARAQALMHRKPVVVTLQGLGHTGHAGNDPDNDDSAFGNMGETPAEVSHALVAPIVLRDIPIGNLQLHDIEPNREWSEGELALIEAIIDQVAQTAENLRLLSDSQERASREQLIGQIGDRLRRASDIEALMKIAVEELSSVLKPARTFVKFGSEAELSVSPPSTKITPVTVYGDSPNGHGENGYE